MQDVVVRTRLNLQFAEDCLKNNGWDVERALANFDQVKVSYPFPLFPPGRVASRFLIRIDGWKLIACALTFQATLPPDAYLPQDAFLP